jgi:hypothetical protein
MPVRALGLAISCVLALALPQRAAAQLGVETSGDRYRETSGKYAAQDLARLARCIVTQRYDRARSFVLAPYGSAEQVEGVAKVVRSTDDPCLRGGFDSVRMSVRPDVLAGGIAQALVLKDYPDLPSVIGGTQVDVAAEGERARQLNATERFGRCLVWRDPAAVHALLSSAHGSNEGRRAVEALKDDMGMCLAEGSTLKINELFLRNITGVAAYRLAHQIRPRGAGRSGGGLVQVYQQKRSAHA